MKERWHNKNTRYKAEEDGSHRTETILKSLPK